VTGPPGLSNVTTPTFSWTAEPGGVFVWAILNSAGKPVRGNSVLNPLAATTVTLQNALPEGSYTFQVTSSINSEPARPAFRGPSPSTPRRRSS